MNWFEMKLKEALENEGYAEFDSYEDYQAWAYWCRNLR